MSEETSSTKKAASRRTPAKAKVAEILDDAFEEEYAAALEEEEAAAEEPSTAKVSFIPNQHATGVKVPSGANFTLSPQRALRMSNTDAADLVATGFGHIEGE